MGRADDKERMRSDHMAKKLSKKSGKVASKKGTVKKAAPKKSASAKKAVAKKPAASEFVAGGPFPVSTGGGASVMDIAQQFMALVREGKEMAIYDNLMHDQVASCEGIGSELEWRGRNATLAKGEEWMKENKIHGARSEGPFVGATGFTVKYEMDVETVKTGERKNFVEVGVYTVRDGKIVREEFMYFCG
jgi:limonene-1,2-epoxide hydrolase